MEILRIAAWILAGAMPWVAAAGDGTGSISGRVVYYSSSGGLPAIEVAVHESVGLSPIESTSFNGFAENYQLPSLPDGSYFISAYADLNGSGGPPDPGEPLAWYDPNGDCMADAVVISNQEAVPGINIAIGNIIFVDQSALGLNDGSCWDNAFTDLADGLAAASADSEVWVADGTYYPTDDGNRTVAFFLKNGVAVHGGFAGNEILRWPRDWTENLTVLSGEIGVPGISDNSYRVVAGVGSNETAVLATVVVSDGNADGGFPRDQGGGLIVDNRFSSSADTGASVFNVLFLNNSARFHGGAVAAQSASPTLVNCQFTGNTSGANGAAVASLNSGVPPGNPLIVNSTFASNSAPQGIVTALDSSSITVRNSIVWNNSGATAIGVYGSASASVSYSLIEGGFNGTGNLNVDPLYFDLDGEDDVAGNIDDEVDLAAGSPAIDAGDNSALVADIADLDSDGDRTEPVPLGLFALPRLSNDPSTMDTGVGTPPVVDLGAVEFQPPDGIFSDGFENPPL